MASQGHGVLAQFDMEANPVAGSWDVREGEKRRKCKNPPLLLPE